MLKKLKRSWLYCLLLVSLVFLGYNPEFSQAGYSSLKDTISDSRSGSPADHVVEFTTTIDIGASGYFELTLASQFGDINNAGCSGPNAEVSTTTETVRCTYSSSPGAATTTYIYIYDVANPGSIGSYLISVASYNSGDVLQESGEARVAILNGLEATASITENIGFNLSTSTDITHVNGIAVTGTSTVSTLPFGTLSSGASSTLAHTIGISTNASNGFSCTVEQDQELTNESGKTINSFDNSPDGSGSTTPHAWNEPDADIHNPDTYGHLGLTTDDFTLAALDFSGSKFAGLNGTEPIEIAYHDGPSAENSLGAGLAHIAYSVQITDLQEAGSYNASLTYICTANF